MIMQQKTRRGLDDRRQGEARALPTRGAEIVQTHPNRESPPSSEGLMESILNPINLRNALKKVRSNKGAAGVDGMSVSELPDYLKHQWPKLKAQLLMGRYKPQPVRRVNIPKQTGGSRKLGIPCVLDRFIQQAVMQVLQNQWDPTFSENSYGFRPGRSAHQAVKRAKGYIEAGYHWVVDLDLEKFFDRVNHDVLMSRIAKRITDKRVLKLIRNFLQAGVMDAGLVSPQSEGTPQGGPLSPLLSNLLLDDFDRELEKRGLKHVRYADDANIYVRSERAGQRVKGNLTRWLTNRLKLKVNEEKSAVSHPENRKFLGYSFRIDKRVWCIVAPESMERFKRRIREMTRRATGKSLKQVIQLLKRYVTGWMNYYSLNEWPSLITGAGKWIRRRLRSLLWRQWKTGWNRFDELYTRGVSRSLSAQTAGSSRSTWRISQSPALGIALPNRIFHEMGLPTM